MGRGTMTFHILLLLLTAIAIPAQARTCESDVQRLTKQGKQLFNGNGVCFACHGRSADGKTDVDPRVSELNPKPSDLKNAATLKYSSDEARYSIIRNGIAGTGMPPFRGSLTDQAIRLLIEYLEVLKTG